MNTRFQCLSISTPPVSFYSKPKEPRQTNMASATCWDLTEKAKAALSSQNLQQYILIFFQFLSYFLPLLSFPILLPSSSSSISFSLRSFLYHFLFPFLMLLLFHFTFLSLFFCCYLLWWYEFCFSFIYQCIFFPLIFFLPLISLSTYSCRFHFLISSFLFLHSIFCLNLRLFFFISSSTKHSIGNLYDRSF